MKNAPRLSASSLFTPKSPNNGLRPHLQPTIITIDRRISQHQMQILFAQAAIHRGILPSVQYAGAKVQNVRLGAVAVPAHNGHPSTAGKFLTATAIFFDNGCLGTDNNQDGVF
jgi:hypothetical protein